MQSDHKSCLSGWRAEDVSVSVYICNQGSDMTRSPSGAVQKEAGRSGDDQSVQIRRGKFSQFSGTSLRKFQDQQDGVTNCFHADGTPGPR